MTCLVRLGAELPCIRKFNFEERGRLNRIVLAPEVTRPLERNIFV